MGGHREKAVLHANQRAKRREKERNKRLNKKLTKQEQRVMNRLQSRVLQDEAETSHLRQRAEEGDLGEKISMRNFTRNKRESQNFRAGGRLQHQTLCATARSA